MTKVELIRKIAKLGGIPDSEAKLFFETLLNKFLLTGKPGDAIQVKPLGSFILKKGKMKKALADQPGKEDVVYTDLVQFEREGEEKLLFNIPVIKPQKFDDIDSYFSLGVGKPGIPLEGTRGSEFFVPTSGAELKKLIDTRADKIIQDAETIKNYSDGDNVIFIRSGKEDKSQIELGLKGTDEETGEERSSEEETTEYENVPWDFGTDLSKQIEEEALLDLEKEEFIMRDEDEEPEEKVSWDFGRAVDDFYTPTDITVEQEFEQPEPWSEKTKQYENEPEEEPEKYHYVEPEEKEEKEEVKQPVENRKERDFEKVKSLTAEFTSIYQGTGEDEQTEWDIEKPQEEPVDRESFREEVESPHEREFTQVTIEAEPDSVLAKQLMEEGTVSPQVDEKARQHLGQKLSREFLERTREMEKNLWEKSKQGSKLGIVFVAIGTILVVTVAVLLFNFLTDVFGSKKIAQVANDAGEVRTAQVIIPRDYSVPVNYPYDGTNDIEIDEPVDPAALDTQQPAENEQVENIPEETVTEKQTPAPPPETSVKTERTTPQQTSEIKPSSNAERVRGNIYNYNGTYVVQVSSWQALDKANVQVERFKNRGYNAFVEKAEIPGRGTWYRVRIGGFTSLAEAEKFANSN